MVLVCWSQESPRRVLQGSVVPRKREKVLGFTEQGREISEMFPQFTEDDPLLSEEAEQHAPGVPQFLQRSPRNFLWS